MSQGAPGGGAWTSAFDGQVLIREDGQCAIFNPVLRDLFLIYEHYKAQGEKIIVFHNDPRRPEEGRYVVSLLSNVLSDPPMGYEAKVKVENGIVHEYGREELD